jgi:prophage regulatory protein
MRLLNREGLREKGIPFSRAHLHRLVAAGEFPRPVKIGGGTCAWVESEVNAYLERKLAERDGAAAEASA